ncbi:uncharacterized protein LOC118881463 isoform X4 [Balaenoptera musculus]|uniref:Uncharacterized protein LOC118881463 isoform X4 n=1 Tax=Balaenoptera musculus TaxID=9771 RepID=A0A8B8VBQ8_BALMU|nr:uncharacterized protein LOC118881463 isoform X4 [Balaenoptera musculus]
MPNLGWWRSWTPARTLRTHCTHTGPGRRPSSSTLCSTSTPPSKMCTCHPPALSGRRHFWIQRDGVCPRPLRCCQRPVSPGGNEVGGSGALPNSTKHLVCAGLALVPLHPLAPLVLSTALKGASKTHTMLRMDAGPGIYLQMLTDLFQAVEETRESTDCSVSMSCLEIYNEVIWDLLKPSSGFLDLREDSRGSIQIAGIAEVSASNTQELRVTGAHGGTCGSSTSATLTSAHRAEPDTQLQSCFRAKGTANFCITSPLSSPVLRADITNGSRTLPSASRCMERVATQGPLTICPLLLLSSDHAAPHQRQLAVHTGVHRHQQDVVPLPRRAAGHRAPAQPRHRHGRGSAHWEALHGGPGGLGAGASDPEPRQEDEGGRPHQPLPAGAGQRHQRAQREGRQPGAVRELPGRKLTRACCRCPSWGSQLALTLATSRHQVKRNLLNVSYHIAQYADVISDLGRQIKHPKAKVEKQEKEKRSIPEADTLQAGLEQRLAKAKKKASPMEQLPPTQVVSKDSGRRCDCLQGPRAGGGGHGTAGQQPVQEEPAVPEGLCDPVLPAAPAALRADHPGPAAADSGCFAPSLLPGLPQTAASCGAGSPGAAVRPTLPGAGCRHAERPAAAALRDVQRPARPSTL